MKFELDRILVEERVAHVAQESLVRVIVGGRCGLRRIERLIHGRLIGLSLGGSG